MAYTSVALKTVTVNLAEEQQMQIVRDQVWLVDARAYSPKLVAVMNLDDAVTVARAILAYVEAEHPVLCPVCGSDVCDCNTPGYVPNVSPNFVPPMGPDDLPY